MSGGLVELRSPGLRVVLDPSHGGCIRSIRTSPGSADWIFFDPSRRLQGVSGRSYDDVWAGGFEELFPNDAPGPFDGRDLPDHGELWSEPLEVVDADQNGVTLRRNCKTVPALFEKRVRLDPRAQSFTIDYRIVNQSTQPLRFLFKLHPAMAVEPGDRIVLPGGTVIPVDPAFGTRLGGARSPWPVVPARDGGSVDLSLVPARDSRSREFVYVTDLTAGWCGIQRAGTGERIVITFPREVFPYCWLFLSYGGWRDYYTAVLEPCTNLPKDLGEAAGAGQCATLAGGAELRCTVSVAIEKSDA